MKKIKILDCTLRDGGYINNWNFKNKNIKVIYNNLIMSKIDYIEIGYLDENVEDNKDITKFPSFNSIDKVIKKSTNTVCMIDYGKFNINSVPNKNETKVSTIRVAFSKNDIEGAIKLCEKLQKKGYKVFVQPMVTSLYSESEIDFLLEEVNRIKPYAVYIVDSFGSMNEKEVKRLLKLYNSNLDSSIAIGFHCHNNLQLAYSNAKTFIENCESDEIIVDSSVYGMGRGAGNLQTELLSDYLNNNFKRKIKINYLLEIVDNYLLELKKEKSWGYCLEYYLSAVNKCHPNYSKFLSELHTMTIYDMEKILNKISNDKKSRFDKEYIQELYTAYMNNKINDKKSYKKLEKLLKNRKIALLGNGKSLVNNKKTILEKIDSDTVIISLNSDNYLHKYDYIFVSNRRRFNMLNKRELSNIICTSNIDIFPKDAIVFDYIDNLADEYEVSDNVLLIFLNILIKANIKEVYLGGFDGFSYKSKNFYSDKLLYYIEKERAEKTNSLMSKYINLYEKKIKINWLTESSYIQGGRNS